ncbi:hypothetical protein THAOC_35766, partial [Thalassiosira oceanica]
FGWSKRRAERDTRAQRQQRDESIDILALAATSPYLPERSVSLGDGRPKSTEGRFNSSVGALARTCGHQRLSSSSQPKGDPCSYLVNAKPIVGGREIKAPPWKHGLAATDRRSQAKAEAKGVTILSAFIGKNERESAPSVRMVVLSNAAAAAAGGRKTSLGIERGTCRKCREGRPYDVQCLIS